MHMPHKFHDICFGNEIIIINTTVSLKNNKLSSINFKKVSKMNKLLSLSLTKAFDEMKINTKRELYTAHNRLLQ
jgi:hypothetical protein